MDKALPILIMAESFIAALIYFGCGKPGAGLYWVAAGLLNLAVIFLIPGEI